MRLPSIPTGSKLPNWHSTIKHSSSNGKWKEVLSHYREMKRGGVQLAEPSLLCSILKAASALSFTHGKSIHACLLKQGLDSFTSVGNSSLDFYMKWGTSDSALRVFGAMDRRDSVSWNIMIHGFLQEGDLEEGLLWFAEARIAGFEPNTSTLVLVIHTCRSLGIITLAGLKIHAYIIRNGFGSIPSVQNSLLSMYADADIGCAHEMFDEMTKRDVVSWSVMIGGYVQIEEAQLALCLFREMVSEAMVEPDGVTTVGVIRACTVLRDIGLGKSVHGFTICRGFEFDLFVGNSLIDMYSKCNEVDLAFGVFKEMPHKNNVSWNSILSGFVQNENHSASLGLFDSMRDARIEVDGVTLVNLLQTCKHFVDASQCKLLHSMIIRRGFESNELVINSLLDAYAKSNLVELAWKLFHGMKRRDMVSWSTMIAGFTYCGKPDEAIAVFQSMNEAQENPSKVTILNLLEACSASAELRRSKWAHGIALRRGLAADVAVGTAIIDMYSKCGAIEASRKAFHQIPQKNIVSWGSMIQAYSTNGLPNDALSLFSEMKQHGLKPNAVTALSVLSACSRGGLVEEGLSVFQGMVQDDGIKPKLEHYSCMVDMLGRAGMIDPALELIENLPRGLEASGSLWGAFLSACRCCGNSELGARALSRVLELEPSSSGGYMLASSMYTAGGLWNEAAKVRLLAKERRVKVMAGYSSVHVGNRACRFVAGDESHPRAAEVGGVVKQLHICMRMDKESDATMGCS
ncbi:pentatricopeptide repeat-containing protein At2g17210 [Malania oleifera]|uniref:pentatricopeptide repeat-containing protein At2g17210 n=1 Tax=Malania oleifera TaxID=397392 RepID=UPI0025ADC21C|nr:pentatricopeptide repeat-containing protein At2g17210 [Malania oleifera]